MNMKLEVRPGRVLNILVEKNPESTTTLFLIHGLGGRGDQWRKQVKRLKSQYTLIVPDLLGHGHSDKPKPKKNNNPYEFLEFSRDLQVILDKFADKKNIVIGHSYGGALTAYLTSKNPDKIARQILVAPSRCKPFYAIPKIYYLPAFMLEMLRPFLENAFRKFAFDKSTKNKVVSEEEAAGKRNRLYVIKSMLHGMANIPVLEVSKLETSTLILTGESDKIIPFHLIEKFYAVLPQREFFVVEQAGHMLQLEQPDKVNQQIENFLK
jgi:pimeloyl-ACP methyl ester carboxylesterase